MCAYYTYMSHHGGMCMHSDKLLVCHTVCMFMSFSCKHKNYSSMHSIRSMCGPGGFIFSGWNCSHVNPELLTFLAIE